MKQRVWHARVRVLGCPPAGVCGLSRDCCGGKKGCQLLEHACCGLWLWPVVATIAWPATPRHAVGDPQIRRVLCGSGHGWTCIAHSLTSALVVMDAIFDPVTARAPSARAAAGVKASIELNETHQTLSTLTHCRADERSISSRSNDGPVGRVARPPGLGGGGAALACADLEIAANAHTHHVALTRSRCLIVGLRVPL
jgi:hypothetical protein